MYTYSIYVYIYIYVYVWPIRGYYKVLYQVYIRAHVKSPSATPLLPRPRIWDASTVTVEARSLEDDRLRECADSI